MTVFNCMMFLNENDILEIKINTHWKFVDKFIIVESCQTHTGDYKGYNFDKQRFMKYSDKIIYKSIKSIDDIIEENPHLVDHMLKGQHELAQNETAIDWVRDSVQSALIPHFIIEAGGNPEDIALIDCCDEILSPNGFKEGIQRVSTVSKFITNKPEIFGGRKTDPIFGFQFRNYYYKANLQNPSVPFIVQSMMTTVRTLMMASPSTIRHYGVNTHPPIDNGGWHFGFLDSGKGEALQKFKSWAHSRDKKTNYYETVQTNEDAEHRLMNMFNLQQVPISNLTHPQYLIDNLTNYTNLLYRGANE